jgi:chorismate dehydratase
MLSGMPLRVGSVPYLVGRPLDEELEREPGLELVRAVPAELVQGLRAGRLDVALVSSIELFRRPGYRFLSGTGVIGRGAVSSVQVFHERPLREVTSVALDPASAAAATLAQVLLDPRSGAALPAPERPAAPPRFVEVPAGVDPRASGADAWLRIGDRALSELWADDAPPALDLSAAWHRTSGLPFVFAVWIVRPGVAIEPFAPAFARARELGIARRGELARSAARAWGLSEERCRRYLVDECVSAAGAELERALWRFRDAAAALGLCQGDLEPRAVPDPERTDGRRAHGERAERTEHVP